MRQTTKQPHIPAIVQAFHFSHIEPDETDAKKILTASPFDNWRRPPRCPRTTLMKTIIRNWNPIICPWMKQLTWLSIVHSVDWCLRLALCTLSGACQKWMNEWMNEWVITKTTFIRAYCISNSWLAYFLLIIFYYVKGTWIRLTSRYPNSVGRYIVTFLSI